MLEGTPFPLPSGAVPYLSILVCFPRVALKEKLWPYPGAKRSTLIISWVAKFMQTRGGSSLPFLETWPPEC